MSRSEALHEPAYINLSDINHRVGQLVGGGQQSAPCSVTDIRRWVMAMDYPNPIHWDEEFARTSKFGGLIAPQSAAVAFDCGHGVQPACVGHIPGSHLLFGGEEWWFYGHRIRPGDQIFQERRFHDYKITETKFAGPTMFARGDTVHHTQYGTPVAKVRSTAIRYLVAEAEKRKKHDDQPSRVPRWTHAQLDEIEKVRYEWLMSNRAGTSSRFSEVRIGDKLPRRVLGPHSIISFTTEYRAFIDNVWGSYRWVSPAAVKDPWINQDPGWIEGFGFDEEGAKIDPRKRDGLYLGPSRGHVDAEKAEKIGMARAYGYGATMGAWLTDYLAYWAGHDGFVRHVKSSFRGPAFEGDVTYFEGEIIAKDTDSCWGTPLVTVKVRLTNQDGSVLVDAAAELELPF